MQEGRRYLYTKNVRINLRTLPSASGGVVLRTIFQEPWEHADGFWSYQVQDMALGAQHTCALRKTGEILCVAPGQARPAGAI